MSKNGGAASVAGGAARPSGTPGAGQGAWGKRKSIR